jgi:quinoprotein glucose dehydrogenase
LQKKWKINVELNPVFINNKIIVVTADWKIVALDAETGNLIWKLQSDFMPSRRGMVVENDKKSNLENLFIPIGSVVYKINAKNGKVVKKFGKNGFVKAFTLVAPIIYKNKIIIVSKHKLFIFNKNTGEFIDKIEIHPKGINYYGGIVWGGAALDKNKGIVYVNTGNPKPALLGVSRPGNNKRSNSVVAIDLNKGKIIWDFQEVSHDLWDFDIPSPPIIHNLVIDEKIYEVVISVTKTGNTIILDRNNGKPIFDITYKKAPRSKIYNEITAPFQIYINKPERFSKIEYAIEDIDKLSQESRNEIINILKKSNYGWFETPSFEKNLITFGLHGGALWSGATIDPKNQHLYIPVNNIPWILKNLILSSETYTSFPDKLKDHHKVYINKCSSCHGKKRNGLRSKRGEKLVKHIPSLVGFYLTQNKSGNFDSLKKINDKHKKLDLTSKELEKLKKLFKWWDEKLQKNDEITFRRLWHVFETKDGLPASNPPWGYIAKLDLVNGKILFKSPVGYKNINGKREKIGTANYGGVALNGAGILFFTGTEDSMVYAIDANNGKELWSYKMKAAGSAPPIIFNLSGKQYVSFVSTGGIFHNFKEKDSTIYTFTILD